MRPIDGDALISAMIKRISLCEACQTSDRLSGYIDGLEESIGMARDIVGIDLDEKRAFHAGYEAGKRDAVKHGERWKNET